MTLYNFIMNKASFITSHSLRRLFGYAYCYILLEYFPQKFSSLTPLVTHIRVPTKIKIFWLIAGLPGVYPNFVIHSNVTNDESSKKFSIHNFFKGTPSDYDEYIGHKFSDTNSVVTSSFAYTNWTSWFTANWSEL